MTVRFAHDMTILRAQVKRLIQREVEEIYAVTSNGVSFDSDFERLLDALIARVTELQDGNSILIDDVYSPDEVDEAITSYVEDVVSEAWEYRFPSDV